MKIINILVFLVIIAIFVNLRNNLIYSFFNKDTPAKYIFILVKRMILRFTFGILLILLLLSLLYLIGYTKIPLYLTRELHKIRPYYCFDNPSDINFAQSVIEGDVSKVKMLIDKGANVNAKGKINITPLYLAFHFQHPDVFNLLLDYKADPTIKIYNSDNINDSNRHQLRQYEIIYPDLLVAAANDLNPSYILSLLKHGYCSDESFYQFYKTEQGLFRRRWMTQEEFGTYPSPQELSRLSEIKLEAFLKAGVDYKRKGKESVLDHVFESPYRYSLGGNKCFYSCIKKLLELKTPITSRFLKNICFLQLDISYVEKQGAKAVQDFNDMCEVLYSAYPEMRQDIEDIKNLYHELWNLNNMDMNRNELEEKRKSIFDKIDALLNNIVEKYNAAIEKKE